MDKVASRAGLWYNRRVKKRVASALLQVARCMSQESEFLTMDSLYPHAQDSNPTKTCTKCKQVLPATKEFFNVNKQCKYGVTSTCRVCTAKSSKPGVLPPEGSIKQCTTCKQFLPATPEYFNNQKSCSDGLHTQCKECRSKVSKAHYYQPDVHEKSLAQAKEYRERPGIKEKRQTALKEWLERPENNENYKRDYTREYRTKPGVLEKKHADDKKYMSRPECKAHRLEYERDYLAIPEKRERHRSRDRVNQHTRRSRKREVQGTHTTDQIQDQLKRQKYKCYYAACGHAKFKKEKGKYFYHIEHTFPLSRAAGSDIPANDMSYLVLSCPDCNMSKGNKRPHEWLDGGRLL